MFKKIIYTLLGLFFTYTAFAFFVFPLVLKSQASKYVKEELNKDLVIEKISFNPFLFKLNLHNTVLKEKENTLLSFENIFIDFDLDRTLANKYLHFKILKLSKPFINIVINEQKELNLLSLIPSSNEEVKVESKEKNSELLKVQVDAFVIEDANIAFSDFSLKKPFLVSLENINYILRDLNTLKNKIAAQTLSSQINQDSNFSFKGGLSLNPLKTYGNLELKDFKVDLIWNLIKDNYPISFDKNLTLNSKLGFIINLENEPLILLNDSSISLNNFHLKDKNNQTLLFLDQLALTNLNLKFPNSVKTNSLQSDFTLLINNSTLKTNSIVYLDPLDAKIEFNLENLALNLLNPILSQSTFIEIQSALLSAQGNINYENNTLIAQANSSLNQVVINHLKEPIIKAQAIEAKNIEFNQAQNQLSIASVDMKEPYAFIQIDKNSGFNLANLMKPSNSNTQEEKQKEELNSPKTDALLLNFGPLTIKNGTMTFEDLTLPLAFKIENHNISGFVSQLNTKGTKPSVIKLNGNIGKYGNMKINGDLVYNDFKSYSDLKIDFNNIALNDLSGYSGKFVGRKIDDGKLTLDLSYFIEKGKLEAKNNLVISKIKLGEKIQSEEALNLPLELAIAILEDRNGVIDLKLPLKGDLDNPEFSVAPIIWQAFTNLLAKAITAPFSLLGSLFGFGEDEINSVPFYFGEANISAMQKEPLDKITEILQSRTKLVIKMNPVYDGKNDLFALQTLSFKEKTTKALEKVKEEEYAKEYTAYLEALYTKLENNLKSIEAKYTQEKVLNQRLYKQELETILIKKESIDTSLLETLALKRTENIVNYLVQQKVDKNQIEIGNEVQNKSSNEKFSVLEIALDSLD
ncbi:MAG: DUF748 domain-containing protein [Arcobacteraceae bacterium]